MVLVHYNSHNIVITVTMISHYTGMQLIGIYLHNCVLTVTVEQCLRVANLERKCKFQLKNVLHCCAVDCVEGELRLVEGETEWEGRLEVCFSQRWGTVGNDGWTEVNSQVVCNNLGFDITGMHTHNSYQCLPLK